LFRTSRYFKALLVTLTFIGPSGALHAQEPIDVMAYFARAAEERGAGLARKTKVVDVRPAKPGEVIITMIRNEGKETQSPPAQPGDMVVRNRCPETGNEEFLVGAGSFTRRYEGPSGAMEADGWTPYRPRGIEMRFVKVAAQDGSFTFKAPWDELMVARTGDYIVQDPKNARDTYRVANAAFACTYEIVQEPAR